MVIDSHAHVTLPMSAYLAALDAAGADRAVLFSTLVHPEQSGDMASFGREMGRLGQILGGANAPEARLRAMDELGAALATHGDRLIGFGSAMLGLGYDETGRWIEQQVLARGCVGLGEVTLPAGGVALLRPVFAAAGALGGLPIWVHTFDPMTLADIRELVALAQEFPRAPLILGHIGGLHWMECIQMAKGCASAYLDLSATYTRFAPMIAARELPERTLFSSDYPYGDPVAARVALERAIPDRAVLARVLGENAEELLAA